MSSADKNSEVEVENVAAAEEKAETKEVKGVKRPAEVSMITTCPPPPSYSIRVPVGPAFREHIRPSGAERVTIAPPSSATSIRGFRLHFKSFDVNGQPPQSQATPMPRGASRGPCW